MHNGYSLQYNNIKEAKALEGSEAGKITPHNSLIFYLLTKV